MRLLLVEDDKKISGFVGQGLRQEGHVVESAQDGIDGFHLASTAQFDAAIVDIMLPRMDGLELVQELRRQGIQVPVLILSAKTAVDDRIRGLRAGGDDYLTTLFAFGALLARVEALVRRANAVAEPTSLTVHDLSLDLIRRRVMRGDQEIELQPREFALLEYLMRNKGRVVTKTMIMEQVWGYDFDPQTNVVESRISRLRDKLDAGGSGSIIRTVRGAGYIVE